MIAGTTPKPHPRRRHHLSYTHYNTTEHAFLSSSPNSAAFQIKTQWIGITCMQFTSPQVPPSKTIHDQLRPIPRSSYRAIIYVLFSKRAPITVILADSVCLYRSFDERSRERRETKVDKASSGFVDILR